MGCTDSQVNPAPSSQTPPSKTKAIRFAPQVEDDTAPIHQNDLSKSKKSKSKSKSKGKGKGKEDEGSPAEEKENTVRVKKARNLRHHPQHQKFIEDILQQSRAKLTVDYPQIPKTSSGFIKPVVEYAPPNKGQILPNEGKLKERSRWNIPISEADPPRHNQLQITQSYISVNEAAKSPYKQKQIERRLNSIRNGRFEESMSGQLIRNRPQLFQEMSYSYVE